MCADLLLSMPKQQSPIGRLMLAAVFIVLGLFLPEQANGQATPQPTERITFDEAVRLALEQNYALQRSANAVELQSINVSRQRANFLPNLSLSSSGSQSYGRSFSEEAGGIVNQTTERLQITAGTGINLFNGFGDVASLEQARLQLEASDLDFERQRQTVVFQVMSSYLDLIQRREQVQIQEENLAAQEQLLAQIQEFVNVGTRPMSDLRQQEFATENARLNLLEAQRMLQLAEISLIQILQLDPFGAYEFVVPELDDDVLVPEQYSVRTMMENAYERRLDLQAQENIIEAADANIRAARSSYWPSIDLSANYGTGWDSQFIDRATGEQLVFSDQLNENRRGGVSLSLSLPIFDRFITRNNTQQARVSFDNARLDLDNLQQDVALQVRQAYLDYLTNQQRLDVTEAQLRSATLALEAEQERYNVGASTLVELTQAQANFVQAQSDRADAMYSFLFSKKLIDYYVGVLDPSVPLFE